MTTNVFQRPETVPIHAENKNWLGEYTDPSQGVKIDIYHRGTKVVSGQAMEREDTGKYVYYYNTSDSSPTGWYYYTCTAIDGGGAGAKTVITDGSFKLK